MFELIASSIISFILGTQLSRIIDGYISIFDLIKYRLGER